MILFAQTGVYRTESCCNYWGSKKRREGREKGILTAGHTHTTFQVSAPGHHPLQTHTYIGTMVMLLQSMTCKLLESNLINRYILE